MALPASDISDEFKNAFRGGELVFEYHTEGGCSCLYDIKWKGKTVTKY